MPLGDLCARLLDRRFLRYLLASVGALAVDMGLFMALLAGGVAAVAASAIGYGAGIAAGMQVEEGARLYTVTDVAEGKVVLDGNHPLAGMALRFACQVVSVRTAKAEEISRGVSLP